MTLYTESQNADPAKLAAAPPTTMNQALSQARQVNMSADGVIEVLQ